MGRAGATRSSANVSRASTRHRSLDQLKNDLVAVIAHDLRGHPADRPGGVVERDRVAAVS
jgi:hypothetical protein